MYSLNKWMDLYYSLPNNRLNELIGIDLQKYALEKFCLIALELIKVLRFSEVFAWKENYT